MRRRVALARALLVMTAVLVADQLTKRWIADSITPGQQRHVLPGLQFVHTMNQGVAFGFLPGDDAIVAAIIGLCLVALLVYFLRHASRSLVWLPTGLLLGGAVSNVLDRVRDGSVTDFIKLPLGWPPFNVADMCITVGVVVLALLVEQGARRPADGVDALAPRGARPEEGGGPGGAEPGLGPAE
jgi:signal peptidase II